MHNLPTPKHETQKLQPQALKLVAELTIPPIYSRSFWGSRRKCPCAPSPPPRGSTLSHTNTHTHTHYLSLCLSVFLSHTSTHIHTHTISLYLSHSLSHTDTTGHSGAANASVPVHHRRNLAPALPLAGHLRRSLQRERVFIELITSDRKLKASNEGSK